MSKLMTALKNIPHLKTLLGLIKEGEIDLTNDPFGAFKWFDATPANTQHALLNVLLILEGHPPIEYDDEGTTIDSRLPKLEESRQ